MKLAYRWQYEQEAAANDINCRIPFRPAKRLSPFASLSAKGQIGIVVVENLIGQAVLPADPLRRLGSRKDCQGDCTDEFFRMAVPR